MNVARASHRRASVVFGGLTYEGRWQVPRHLAVDVVMGSAKIDLRDVSLPAEVTELAIRLTGGNITVIVPPDLPVEVSGDWILGNIDGIHRVRKQQTPDKPLLKISGFTLMGKLNIFTREQTTYDE